MAAMTTPERVSVIMLANRSRARLVLCISRCKLTAAGRQTDQNVSTSSLVSARYGGSATVRVHKLISARLQ